jgi:hypothetical protein
MAVSRVTFPPFAAAAARCIPMHNTSTFGGKPMRPALGLLTFFSMLCLSAAQEQTYIGRHLTDFPGPRVYKDPTSGTLLYIETDGRHVAAISVQGKLLWNRDPFKDAHLPFYRTEKPQIVYIGPASKFHHPADEKPERFVEISFNNSQFGLMRISNGEFLFSGQD